MTPLVRLFALRNGFIPYPRSDRWHKNPTANLGGVGIYFAFLISAIFFNFINKAALGLIAGGTFLFIVGLIDDKFHLTPYTKLFSQIIAGCIAIFFGSYIGLPIDNLFTIPLTLIWIVVVTNSFNLLDNIDGLSAGIAAISSLMLSFLFITKDNNTTGMFGFILAGAALGFLPYNFNPARIFMGDSGSMFLGYSLSIISISGTVRHISNLLTTMLVPVLILSVPIFDTIFVTVLRKFQGRKIFEGGKDHTSHHLVTLGLSQRKTVLLLYAVSIIFGLIAIFYWRLDIVFISIIVFLAITILMFFGFFLSETVSHDNGIRNHHKRQAYENKTILNSIFLHKRRMVEVLLDLGLICVAYYSAYFLRFEGTLIASNMRLLEDSLAWIILIKMSIFFVFGLYRGVWRYVSISDMLTIFKVVSLASIASILFLTFVFRFQDYSRAVFFIDWLVLLFLVSGARISFRVLGEFFSRLREKGKNVLIFGAGDTGEMVIREIKRNKTLDYNPIGFIDDDPSKIGDKIQGVEVLGSRNEIKNLVMSERVEEIIIAIPSLLVSELSEIIKVCKDCGIPYRRIKGILDREEADDFKKN